MNQANDLSVASLLSFIDRFASKGQISNGTAAPLKSSCSRVLGALDAEEQSDVSTINIEGALRRFANLNPSVGPQSLRDYRSRIERAITMFTAYRADPVNWTSTSGRVPRAKSEPTERVERRRSTKTSKRHVSGFASAAESVPDQISSGLSYPYPLRADLTIMISNLPRDLRLAEAERLAAFLRSLAEDYKPS